jgi:hypothetical protein
MLRYFGAVLSKVALASSSDIGRGSRNSTKVVIMCGSEFQWSMAAAAVKAGQRCWTVRMVAR